ncbi:MAG: hypothetical protein ACK5HY_02070, partial [Parahaliea sp.]
YRARRTCQLDGWVLSDTECRLIALRHLLLRQTPGQEQPVAAETQVAGPREYPEAEIAELNNWGPRWTLVGQPFNVQLDGHNGLWFQIAGAPAHAKIAIDGQLARTSVGARVVTSGLFGEQQTHILATPGRYPIALVDPVRAVQQHIGYFEVRDPAAETALEEAFCEIRDWGPQRTRLGTLANPQPDGSLGIWVRTDCLPADARLQVGEDLVPSGVRPPGLTGAIPPALLAQPGRRPLSIYSPRMNQRVVLGDLLVED